MELWVTMKTVLQTLREGCERGGERAGRRSAGANASADAPEDCGRRRQGERRPMTRVYSPRRLISDRECFLDSASAAGSPRAAQLEMADIVKMFKLPRRRGSSWGTFECSIVTPSTSPSSLASKGDKGNAVRRQVRVPICERRQEQSGEVVRGRHGDSRVDCRGREFDFDGNRGWIEDKSSTA